MAKQLLQANTTAGSVIAAPRIRIQKIKQWETKQRDQLYLILNANVLNSNVGMFHVQVMLRLCLVLFPP